MNEWMNEWMNEYIFEILSYSRIFCHDIKFWLAPILILIKQEKYKNQRQHKQTKIEENSVNQHQASAQIPHILWEDH